MLPFLGCARKLLRRHHGGRRDCEDGRVRDRIFLINPNRGSLGVLEHVDILGDALRSMVMFPHFDMEGEGIDRVRAKARSTEVFEDGARADLLYEGPCEHHPQTPPSMVPRHARDRFPLPPDRNAGISPCCVGRPRVYQHARGRPANRDSD